jgi:hypothetical protein
MLIYQFFLDMTRLNRNELTPSELSSLLSHFDHTLSKLNESGMHTVLAELLGREERVMLAKRLTAIVLLYEGYSRYRVSRLLKLSETTTSTILKRIDEGSYDGIIRLLTRKKLAYDDLLNTIFSILHLGGILPQRVGLDRHRSIEQRRAQYRSRNTHTKRRG